MTMAEVLLEWDRYDRDMIVSVYKKVYHQHQIYYAAVKTLRKWNSSLNRLQMYLGFTSSIIALLSASPLTDMLAGMFNIEESNDVANVMQITVGVIALMAARINERIKKKNYQFWISEYEHIITEYYNLKLDIETEIQFPKHLAFKFEGIISRKLQDFQLRHDPSMIPPSISEQLDNTFNAEAEVEIRQCKAPGELEEERRALLNR